MKTRILGILGGIALLLSAGSVYAGGGPPKPEKISFTFTFVDYPNGDPGTCDPATYLPKDSDPACVAYVAAAETLAGDLVGTELEEDSLVGWPDGGYSITGYEMYTATLKGRGTGSFVALAYDGYLAPPPNGFATAKLRIVDGTGTGDLVGISGSGSLAGSGPLPIPAEMTVKFPLNH